MRFTVPQKDFLACIQKLFAVVPNKTTHPILNSILFRLSGNELELTATDLEISISSTLSVGGEKDGELAIPAKRLLDIVRELDEGTLLLQMDRGNHVELRSGSSHFTIPTDPAEQFPELPKITVDTELEMDGERLKQHIDRLGFPVSGDELRPVLTGVYFEFGESCLTLVDTDGHRLV
ncbi:MAG: DNA polymerase III subunit beta, partial [Candidatus Cloacimonetes bacterium]|nr:DNA polymerase III subunit beta [Candidatus Cloacimonadota bacterium]